jgi:hypothetical protein
VSSARRSSFQADPPEKKNAEPRGEAEVMGDAGFVRWL